jgi:hypothetical protein
MDFLDIAVVNLGLGSTQRFKNFDRPVLRCLADLRLTDNLANFLQPAMGVLCSL